MARAWYNPAWPTTNPAKVNLQLTGHEKPHGAAPSPRMPAQPLPSASGHLPAMPTEPHTQRANKQGGRRQQGGPLQTRKQKQPAFCFQHPLRAQWDTWTPSSPCLRLQAARGTAGRKGLPTAAVGDALSKPRDWPQRCQGEGSGKWGEQQGALRAGLSPSIPVLKAGGGDKR